MTLSEFKQKYNGKGIDYDGYYGPQCVDLRKIKLSKFTKVFFSSFVIGLSSLLRRSIVAKIKVFIINHYSSTIRFFKKLIFSFGKTPKLVYSLAIRAILLVGAYTKVFSSIVKHISIYMVNLHFLRRFHNIAVHRNLFLFTIYYFISDSISFLGKNMPLILVNSFEILFIYKSKLALSKGYFHINNYTISTHLCQ